TTRSQSPPASPSGLTALPASLDPLEVVVAGRRVRLARRGAFRGVVAVLPRLPVSAFVRCVRRRLARVGSTLVWIGPLRRVRFARRVAQCVVRRVVADVAGILA